MLFVVVVVVRLASPWAGFFFSLFPASVVLPLGFPVIPRTPPISADIGGELDSAKPGCGRKEPVMITQLY